MKEMRVAETKVLMNPFLYGIGCVEWGMPICPRSCNE